MKKFIIPIIIAITCTANAAINDDIENTITRSQYSLETMYKNIHAHPELGFQEKETSALLAKKMQQLGFSVTEGVGKTGVVAIYKNGPGPVVLVRTELDALPMKEETGLPFASKQQTVWEGKTTYVTHSCGHDVHMSWWLGTAQTLLAIKNNWKGTLVFIAQPAEELISGARAMLEDGLLTRFPKPDYAFAAHVSNIETGIVVVKAGIATSSDDKLNVTFQGQGGHGSMPDKTIDPIIMGAEYINAVQTIISREKNANEFGVITVGSFQSGYAGNIIPDTAELKLSLRSYNPEIRTLLNNRVKQKAKAIASLSGAELPKIEYVSGTGPVYNDPTLARTLVAALKKTGSLDVKFQDENTSPASNSEDFSAFSDAGIPCAFFSIGGYDKKTIDKFKQEGKTLPTNHSSQFAPDYTNAIPNGIRTLTTAVLTVTGKIQ